jgi:hypothetical protein
MNANLKVISLIIITMSMILVPIVVSAETNPIPSWIKNVAGFWADDQTSDEGFVNAMESLIAEGLLPIGRMLVSSDKISIQGTIGPVPSHVFMVSGDMSESTKNALVDAMIELNSKQNNPILKNIYGADALLPTTTIMHIGEFGSYIDALTGLDQKILYKYNLQKYPIALL